MTFNPLMTNVSLIQKTLKWIALQINVQNIWNWLIGLVFVCELSGSGIESQVFVT